MHHTGESPFASKTLQGIIMVDELLDEPRRDFLRESHQQELVAHYCSGLEKQVQSASSRQEAKALVDTSCQNFEHSCPSSIVRKFLSSYAARLFDRHWSSRP